MGFVSSLHAKVEALTRMPVLASIAQRQALAEFKANRDRNLFYGIYPTWTEAETHAAAYGATGYDNSASAQLYVHRMRLDPYDYSSLYWIGRSIAEGMSSVFDVGGSIGIKYYAFLEPLSSTPVTRWLVQDVPAVTEYGSRLARERGHQAAAEQAGVLGVALLVDRDRARSVGEVAAQVDRTTAAIERAAVVVDVVAERVEGPAEADDDRALVDQDLADELDDPPEA